MAFSFLNPRVLDQLFRAPSAHTPATTEQPQASNAFAAAQLTEREPEADFFDTSILRGLMDVGNLDAAEPGGTTDLESERTMLEETPLFDASVLRSLMGGDLDAPGAEQEGGRSELQPHTSKREEADFLAKTWPLLKDFQTGTGGIFDARLSGNKLTIVTKVKFDFVTGDPDPNKMPAGVPLSELQWTSQEEDAFRAAFLSKVTGSWSGRHPIRSTRKDWKTTLDTTIEILEDDAPHVTVSVLKYPPDVFEGIGKANLSGTHSVHKPGTGNLYDSVANEDGDVSGQIWLGSNGAGKHQPPPVRTDGQSADRKSHLEIYFNVAESHLDGEDRRKIGEASAALHGNAGWRAELTGRASADGDAAMNFALARARTQSVEDELGKQGVSDERIVAKNVGEASGLNGQWKAKAYDPTARRVDIDLVEGEDTSTAAHEMGHLFGLGDEYAQGHAGDGAPFDANYMKLIAEHATPPKGGFPTRGDSDSMMSTGTRVETWHYAPFVAAVKKITGSKDWTVRAPPPLRGSRARPRSSRRRRYRRRGGRPPGFRTPTRSGGPQARTPCPT